MDKRILYETHSHTPLCKHAVGQPEEYAAVAHARGLRGLTVTCHNPMPAGFSTGVRMRADQFPEYLDLVARARDQWAGELDVLLGIEADYFEGHEAWLEQQLQATEFHYVLGSVHPQLLEFKERYWVDESVVVQRTYFQLLAQAAETKLFDALAHPDLIKNEFVGDWQPHRIMSDICHALDRIAATGIAMELNTSGLNKRIPEMNPFPQMLIEMQARGIAVVVGADAHKPGRVADNYETAFDLLADCGYAEVSYFRQRQRVDVPIKAARESLCSLSSADP